MLPHSDEQADEVSGHAAPGGEGGLDADEVRGHWSAILDELQQIRRPTWALVSQNAHVHAAQDSTLVLGFATDGLLAAFHRGTGAGNVADAVRRVMRREVMVEAVVGENPEAGGGPQGPDGRGGGGRPGGGPGGRDGRAPQGAGPSTPRGDAPGRPASGVTGTDGRGQQSRGGGSGAGAPANRRSGAAGEHRSAATSPRGMAAGGPGFPADDDLPPEPDDPYPPDPYEAHAADPGMSGDWSSAAPARDGFSAPADRSAPAAREARPTATGGRAPADGGQKAPSRRPDARGQAPEASADPEEHADLRGPARSGGAAGPSTDDPGPAAGVSADRERPAEPAPAGAPDLTPIVIPDDSRDSLPDDTPRTHGQEALRRALETGRPVRTEPRTGATAPQAATAEAPTTSSAATGEGWESRDAPPGSVSPDRASSDRAQAGPASVGPVSPAPADSASGTRPSSTSSAAARRTAPAPSARPDSGPRSASRSGAALVREAALASRAAGPTNRSGSRAVRPGDVEPAPEDPTGGASRDDEDAQYTSRRPQEIVEQMLGGTVLEVIDETR